MLNPMAFVPEDVLEKNTVCSCGWLEGGGHNGCQCAWVHGRGTDEVETK